jgi:ssDNA-binding replication factor A large subunit
MDNYSQLVEFISKNSGVPVDEIDRRIEAKRAKLAGLISKEGAAQIVAAELNISFDKQSIKISQIVQGMRKINLTGKIINLFPVREYNKNGRSGRIGSFVLADETSNMRVVLWDENHIELICQGKINNDSVVEISNATIRNGELHLNSFSEIKVTDKVISNIVLDKPVIKKTISQFFPNERVIARAFIIQLYEPKFFNVCPACKKKVNEMFECITHGKVAPEKRALLNMVLDDGTDSIRAVMFAEQAEKVFGMETLENSELFVNKKQEMLGNEFHISGLVRKNSLYDLNEFIIDSLSDVDLDKLILELESN